MEQVWAFDATKNNRKSIEKHLKEEFYEKWMTVVSTCLLLVLLGGTAQAFGVESTTESNVAVNGIEEEYVKEDRYVDEQGGLVETTEISTRASDKVLWDRHYNGEYSVKKDIYVRIPILTDQLERLICILKTQGTSPSM